MGIISSPKLGKLLFVPNFEMQLSHFSIFTFKTHRAVGSIYAFSKKCGLFSKNSSRHHEATKNF
jgi:hypothetical protein